MDIQFPPELQWVSYLAGGAWPQGSETRMGRISEHFATAAGELQDLLPDLNRVRSETISVLYGDTAMAAVNQFAMLFDGDYSVDKLSKGALALGDGASNLGIEIEYSKLSIIVGLALAAAEIAWCLATAPETGGASLGWIPTIEWTTMTSIRRLVSTVFERIATKLAQMIEHTTIKDLVKEGTKEAFQELGQGLAQEGIVQGVQVGQGKANWRPDLFRQNAVASFVGGGAGGGTALPVAHGLGPGMSKLGRATKGVTTFFSAGIAGNVAGNASVGGEFDTLSIVAGSATSSIGGLKAGGHGHRETNSNSDDPHAGPPPEGGPPPTGPLPDDSPVIPPDGEPDGSQRDDSATTEPAPASSAANGNGQGAHHTDGPQITQSSAADPLPAVTQTNGTAEQQDSRTTSPDVVAHDRTNDNDSGETHVVSPTTQSSDHAGPPAHSSEGQQSTDSHVDNQAAGHHQTFGDPGREPTGGPAENGHAPAVHTSDIHSSQPQTPDVRASDVHSSTDADAATIDHAATPATDNAPTVGADTTTQATPTLTPSTPSASTGTAPVTHSSTPVATPTHSRTETPASPTPKQPVREDVPASPKAAVSASKSSETPAARVQDTTAATARASSSQSDTEQTTVAARSSADDVPMQPRADCVDRVAQALSARYGRTIQLAPFSTFEGAPARVLYETFGSRAEFANYSDVDAMLRNMEPGSTAIVTSQWAGGPNRGGHAYLAVNDGGRIYLEDPFTGRRSGWPPDWGPNAVSRTAVGYLDSNGAAVHPLRGAADDLVAAAAVGNVQGLPSDADGSHHSGNQDPGEGWRHVPSQTQLADDALGRRGVHTADELRNPLGLMEAASERARDNATWWASLTGAEQRALIDAYPHQIGNAEGVPAAARHEANTHALDQQRRELQSWRDRGERLTRFQRRELARLDRIQQALDRATDSAKQAGVAGPQLLAFDSGAFGGDGRAVVSFGEDPYKADSVSWHVPGQGMTVDQIGYCMGDALNHLQSTLQEDSTVSASSIAWIGYDTPSGLQTFRAVGHSMAREGAKILYSDIRAFNTARDTLANDGSHFTANHIFAHSYGSTTASYAGRDGRLANDIRTVSLVGSTGAGPVRHASDFGIGEDNVFVASSSRDPFTALGGRSPGSMGRIFGIGLGVDPAMQSFGGHRVTAEFSSAMDRLRNRGTHNAYYRFVDRGSDPPVRTESLANFGRIASGHTDRIDTDGHRTVAQRPRRLFGGTRERTIEPAAGRPLHLEGQTQAPVDRDTRRPWNPRWRGVETTEDHGGDVVPSEPELSPQERADAALAQRGITAADLVTPVDPQIAIPDVVARAHDNAAWWRDLSEAQRKALIETYPREIGSAAGIPPMARHEANTQVLQRYLTHRDVLLSRRNNGVALSKREEAFIDRMNGIESALRSAERNTGRAGVGGPYLLAFDPQEFGGNGRAIVSFGEDPYTAESVSWYVPGMTTTIDKMRPMMLRAFNQLQSTLRENPNLSAASIMYIGYKAPGSWDPRVTSQRMAIDGGRLFAGDVLAFNEGRDVFTGDGSHFSGNHVFAHSYGSTTVSHAGQGGRLAGEVQTITLIGSPGAGPLRHASDFGIGDNVFVASSSRDRTTGLGGDRAGRFGRVLHSVGQGIDPAMDSFGARRITAEFPAALDHTGRGSRMTHSLYWAYMDPGINPHVRSESLTNFGRIAAGHADRVDLEGHRTLDQRPRRIFGGSREQTVDPAIGRRLRLADDPQAQHAVDRRRPWNPRFRNLPQELVESPPVDPSVDRTPSLDELPAPDSADVQQVAVPVHMVADMALADRGIRAADLITPVDHRVPQAEVVAAAHDNAAWWKSLTEAQQKALIATYPHEVGAAAGIPPLARHAANTQVLQQYLTHRDVLVSRRDNGVALSKSEEAFIDRMTAIEDALRSAQKDALNAGVGGPYLLSFDPRAFAGNGRAIVSFGEDPYTADSVSWYVPGMTTTIDKMRPMMMRAFNQLQSTLHEDPNISAASIMYIGYKAPGSWDPRVGFQRMAREGGQIFASDIMSFNEGRDVFTGDGSHFRANHVFAHSYGSSTVSHAGQGRRLADHMQTVTLIGSPGVGPLRHASEFGIGQDNVFVAASSRDRTTGLGGEHPGEHGRVIARMGQGLDPAMDSFGARRVTAEFPAALDHMGRGSRMTHSLYWSYMDPGLHPHIRSESLTNFGRIAAGQTDRIDPEGHRTLDGRPRRFGSGTREQTVEPALGRPLRIPDDPGALHNVHGRNRWNPNFLRDNECGPAVIAELSARYGREFHLAEQSSPRGVQAHSLFQAIGSASRFATYAQVEQRLRELGPGSSALLASSWTGRGRGGHAYLAVFDGKKVYLFDPHSGETSGWPPHWGEELVRRTAVGYLDSDGEPVDRYDGSTRQLAAAARVGRVRGLPDTVVLADDVLAHRGIRAEDLVNPVGSADLAVARARDNAQWWAGLSDAQRQALIETHPHRIGNAEGIPAMHRDAANRAQLQQLRDQADQVQTKIDEFGRPTASERRFLDRVNEIDLAVRKAEADAARAGLEPPRLLALDASEFSGRGRAVLAFGADPYHADKVSWHTARVPVDRLGTVVRPALDQLHVDHQQARSAAAVIWVGDESGPRAALHGDIAAFHAAREAFAAGEPFTNNRIYTASASSFRERALWVPRDAGSQVVAHRGASHAFPEQTLAAYREALRQGAKGLECDVRLTKDGQLVCIHDKRIDRTSNGTGRVSDMTLEELQQYDFGSQHPSHELPDAQGDTGILTLDELVQLVKEHEPPVTLFVEAKEHGGRLERELVALLERHGVANPPSPDQARVAVISFYPDAIWRVHRAAPDLPTVLLGATARHLATAVGATAIGPSIKTLRANPELVDIAASKGLTTYCWTVNDAADVQFARDLGVGWIATDHPGRTGALLHETPTESAGQQASTSGSHTSTAEDARVVADDALGRRIPPVRPDELRNPLGSMEEARARARNNATWWSGLSHEQQQALIETHPQHIGNAEGIAAAARDTANRLVVQQLRNQADQVQTKIDDGVRTTRAERRLLQRVNRFDLALRKASADAARAGVDGPLLVAFDPAEFGGDGRAVLSFGADPYTADSVSWHVPGVATTVHSLFGFYTECALNQLQSTLTENPSASAASLAWIGYDTPSGWGLVRAAGHGLARTGGELLYSDITAFNAARDTLAGDGSHFTGNHVFGYSYGSTTTGYAGREGRLAGQVSTVSLVGSPGAGPLKHASDFGIGADNVFVASSSRDVVTALGGRTPGSAGRILGIGLGIDPAMDSFGAQRIAAEISSSRNQLLTGGTHHAYYLSSEPGGHARSEALANFGRIAAGHHERLTLEVHRSAGGWHTVEPAASRSDHRLWNTPWRADRDCAHIVADELSSMYGHDIRIAEASTRTGVKARSLFEAVGTRAEFATYSEVAERLRQLGDGSSAVLASRWAGSRNGGHAYLAINEGGEIHLYDPHTRQRSGWPPHWGENAVSRTAVGYLAAHGSPAQPLIADVPLHLAAADAIGRVQGPPVDPDFVRRQAEYREQDPASRHVDTRHAERLADVVDTPSKAKVEQLAADLSGRYGPHHMVFEGESVNGEVILTGRIFHGDMEIGTVQRSFYRDAQGNLVAYHSGLVIKEEFAHLRGQGFSKAHIAELERYYVGSGVDRIELHTHDKGGYAWARRGFTWDLDPRRLQKSLDAIKWSLNQLKGHVGPQARAALAELEHQLDPKNPRLPEPIDIADLATADEPELGRQLLEGVGLRKDIGLDLVRHLPQQPTTQSYNGVRARLKRWLGLAAGPDQSCAHVVADELSTMYGRDIRVATTPSRTGVPAWALFDAVGARAEFATYGDVADRLHQLGDGASAVLASRWAAGRQGGHAYLAINEGGHIQLYDPYTRQRSGWPPHWGQDAVTQTAVGYVAADGNPVHALHDGPLQTQLAAADIVGDVKDVPDVADFSRRQEEYRAQDPRTRHVDTRYAEALADVVDNATDAARVEQLGEDLSGVYGPYRIEVFRAIVDGYDGGVIIGGHIFNGDENIGFFQQKYLRDAAGHLVVEANVVEIPDERFRFKGFSKALRSQLERYYVHSGVNRIELRTEQDGGYVWARQGFTWNPDDRKLQESLDNIKDSARRLMNWVSEDAQAVLEQTIRQLDPRNPRLPEPVDLADLATADEPELGRLLMQETQWHAAKYLQSDAPERSNVLSHSNFEASLPQTNGAHADSITGLNCAHLVAEELSAFYDREFRVAADPTSSGVPARALFEAVGSSARFTTFDEVAETLRQLGDGSSAVLTSRWTGGDGRRGGHAYLAVNEEGEIYLVEPHTGARTGWPPRWGQDAVSATAVGYLDADGNALHPLHDVPLQLGAADSIGDVSGHLEPGELPPAPASLSDSEARAVYAEGELRMREHNEQLLRDGVSAQERARILSGQRDALRARTRELMSNRVVADFLAASETRSTFEELVARSQAKGLVGDEVYDAIIASATNGHYAAGTLSDVETTALYSQFELQMREYNERLLRDGVGIEERARIVCELRSSLRAWTRDLMSNRPAAEWLEANESNPSFEDLVARNEAKGLVGDAVYEAIIESATHSHYAAATLSNAETRTVYTTFELKMREVSEQLLREGVDLEQRARTLYELRASLRTWTRSLMEDRETADYLTANEPNPTFDDLVERQRSKGRVGDAIYEAIIASATRSRASVNESLGIDPENPPELPPMRGPHEGPAETGEDTQ